MTTSSGNSYEANRLRKAGEFEKALLQYRKLYADCADHYNIAGLIHCLRKTNSYEEAIPLCDMVSAKHLDSEWCRREAVWTLIHGKLDLLAETESIEQVIMVADAILIFNPPEIGTRWRVVRRVLKAAKAQRKWNVVSNWIDKIDPLQLTNEPMKDEAGREGWSDRAIWYNIKVRTLIEVGDKERAVDLAKEAINIFPRQRHFFARLEALATLRLSRMIEAERLYADLCDTGRPDWWILYEYAQVLKDLGKRELALKMMCRAAITHHKLESLVSLFLDLGNLCMVMDKKDAACNHFLLCKYVRQKHGWSIPYALEEALEQAEVLADSPTELDQALSKCRQYWRDTLGQQVDSRVQDLRKRKLRAGLTGKVALGSPDRPFCFISIESGESFFCYKSDLPSEIREMEDLVFDAIPSFDKKKNKESWKAANIRGK